MFAPQEGQTALHLASQYGQFNIVCALLLAGAKADILDAGKWIAEQVAEEYEHTQIQGILKSWAENPAETAKKIETQLVLGRVEVAESRLAEMCVMCVTVPQCAGWTPPRLLTSRLHLHGGDSGEADKGERYTKGRGGGPQPPAQSAHSCRVGRG